MIDVSMGARPRARQTLVAIALIAAVAAGCASKGGSTQTATGSSTSAETGGKVVTSAEPDRIVVQHILIGFVGSVPGKNITRNQEEARKLAYDLLERAKKGEDFDELVRANTDDQFPGRYGMANRGVTPTPGGSEYARDGMVPAFGDVGFKLAVGDVGVADYNATTSPYGFHVIKRVQ